MTWLCKPPHHKTAHRGKSRTIAIGPKAQEVLKAFITPDPGDYLFSPKRAVEEWLAERAATRQTPRYPSHMARNAEKRAKAPKRQAAERYNTQAYGLAVDRACDRAFPPPTPLAQREDETHAAWWARLKPAERDEVMAWRKAHRWHPNQLRHTFATRVRKHHGVEAASVLLGHSHIDVTEIYAEKNHEQSASIVACIG